jgi:hypothetical protein
MSDKNSLSSPQPLPAVPISMAAVSRVASSTMCSKAAAKRVLRQMSAYQSFDSVAQLAVMLGIDPVTASAWALREWRHEAIRRRGNPKHQISRNK